jgi:CBS domain-containing protein
MQLESGSSMRIVTSDLEVGSDRDITDLARGRKAQTAKPASIPVGRFMDGPAVRVPSHMTVKGARQIAALKRVNHLLASEGSRVVGLLSSDDWSLAPDTDPVWKWMRQSLKGVSPDMDAYEALAAMERGRTSFLLVSAGVLVLGIVTEVRLRSALSGHRGAPSKAA